MISKISALLEGLSLSDLNGVAPVRLQRFAALCRHWANFADPPVAAPGGILIDLKKSDCSE
jgi:hypothetical protein